MVCATGIWNADKQCLGFHFGEHLAVFLHRAFDDHARAFHIRFDVVRERAGHLHQHLLVAVVGGQVREHFDCRFRRAKVRLVRLGKSFARFGDLRLAHPAGQQRFAVAVRVSASSIRACADSSGLVIA